MAEPNVNTPPLMSESEAEDTLRRLERALGAVSGGLAAVVASQQARRDIINLGTERDRLTAQLSNLREQIDRETRHADQKAAELKTKRDQDDAVVVAAIAEKRAELDEIRATLRDAISEHAAQVRAHRDEIDGLESEKRRILQVIEDAKAHMSRAPALSG